jgi:hypothetical protein
MFGTGYNCINPSLLDCVNLRLGGIGRQTKTLADIGIEPCI